MAARTRGERESHRKFAVDLFNLAWTLMETRRRTREEDLRMIHAAHASRYHWEPVGSPQNLAIGEGHGGRGWPGLLVGGRIRTRRAARPTAKAMAMGGDRILVVGTQAQADRWRDRRTRGGTPRDRPTGRPGFVGGAGAPPARP